MINRTEDRFGLKPERLLGDRAYGSAEILAGGLMGKLSSRMLHYGRNTSVIVGPIPVAILSMTRRLTAIAVRVVKN